MGALISVRDLRKRYGAVRALDGVSLDFAAGEVHAVVGANGAGKSTLAGIISGFLAPSSGEVLFNGSPIPYGSPFTCKHLGIEMVHQHFTLVQEFTVAENLALAGMSSLRGRLDLVSASSSAVANGAELGWALALEARVGELPVGAQQRVEILKALAGDAQAVIFDEPTAVLAAHEVEDLLQVLRRLRDQEKVVILIAHKIREVLSVADRISVLRGGELIGTWAEGEIDEVTLAREMVGVAPEPALRDVSSAETGSGVGKLNVADLVILGDRGNPAINGVSFEIAEGQIVGFGGVDGNGQIELAEALAGVRSVRSGSISFRAPEGRIPSEDIAYIPQDRQHEGLALNMSIEENLLLGAYRRDEHRSGPFLKRRTLKKWASEVCGRFSIRMRAMADPVGSLSGGNQQKVVVGRVLDRPPGLLVAVNPTRGLDVGSTATVHEAIRSAANEGAAVALFSSDPDELAALVDRAFYLGRGTLFGTAEAAL